MHACASQINFVQGCNIDDNDKSGFDAAIKAAEAADATVIVLGQTQKQESEGHDRTSIDLPGVQVRQPLFSRVLIRPVALCKLSDLVYGFACRFYRPCHLAQHDFIAEVAAAAAKDNKPVVLVIMSGSSVDLSAEKADPNVGAIIFAGYPGQSGGAAIAQTIVGA